MKFINCVTFLLDFAQKKREKYIFFKKYEKDKILVHSRSFSLILALPRPYQIWCFLVYMGRGKRVLAHSRSFSLILALGRQSTKIEKHSFTKF